MVKGGTLNDLGMLYGRFQHECVLLKEGHLRVFPNLKKMHKCWNLPLSKKKKSSLHKNQVWEPIYQKYKANENVSKHNPKKKQKQTINR